MDNLSYEMIAWLLDIYPLLVIKLFDKILDPNDNTNF